ncbi:MAG: DUF309 domain-containing protein [Alicyclobacillaceae bacterium]|nr:DUF309 domain-containing protein [Alicyclobacillaceae bacterium]
MHEYPDRFLDFINSFNIERNFYGCHEYGEELWLEHGRPAFLKGLIQTAVSLYHLEGANLSGARKLWRTARAYLSPYQPVHMGIDVRRLIHDMDRLHAGLPDGGSGEPGGGPPPPVYLHVVDPVLEERLRRRFGRPLPEGKSEPAPDQT